MLRHFLITGLRNFWRNKSSTILNILGLAIGMATTLLILEYVFNELSYDRFHENKDEIYRVIVKEEKDGISSPTSMLTAAVAPSMAEEFPEIEHFVRFSNPAGGYLSFGDRDYQLDNITYADSALFEVFTFPLLQGNPVTALSEPYQVVLSETTARKIFGDNDPLGKIIRLNSEENLVVTGIVADFPGNSHLYFDAMISFSSLYLNPNYYLDWDGGYNYFSYVKLIKGADIGALKMKFPAFMEKNINYKYRQFGFVLYLDLQLLERIHLFSKKDTGIDEAGDLQGLYIFSSIAIFILLIACINFMNLTTARSLSRAREIGLRKVSGATRRNIIFQFLFETLLISLFAFLISFQPVNGQRPFYLWTGNLENAGWHDAADPANRPDCRKLPGLVYVALSSFAQHQGNHGFKQGQISPPQCPCSIPVPGLHCSHYHHHCHLFADEIHQLKAAWIQPGKRHRNSYDE
jgi:putative ABC transport system permease protein